MSEEKQEDIWEAFERVLAEHPDVRFEPVINLERAYRIAKELKWRQYPEACPNDSEAIIVRYDDGTLAQGSALHYGLSSRPFQWLPLSALKVLDE